MKIVTEIVRIYYRQLYIPWVHRISPNVNSGSSVNGLLTGVINPKDTPEFYLSEFPLGSWGDIWSIGMLINDRPGAFNDVIELFSGDPHHRINMLTNEIVPVNDGLGYLNVVVDLSAYAMDGSSADRKKAASPKIQFLLDCITSSMIDGIEISGRTPRISGRRFPNLHAVSQSGEMEEGHLQFVNRRIEFGYIELGEAQWLGLAGNGERDHVDVLVTSDTKERYIRFQRLGHERQYRVVEVTMPDQPGQLKKCTQLIKKFGFSIQTAYQDLRKSGELAIWRALVCRPVSDAGDLLESELISAFQQLGFMGIHLKIINPENRGRERRKRDARRAIIRHGSVRMGPPPAAALDYLAKIKRLVNLERLLSEVWVSGSWSAWVSSSKQRLKNENRRKSSQ